MTHESILRALISECRFLLRADLIGCVQGETRLEKALDHAEQMMRDHDIRSLAAFTTMPLEAPRMPQDERTPSWMDELPHERNRRLQREVVEGE